ncbi:tetratricopeptide repeat protein 38 [Hydra vulgaris]|uniref:Tetratricopeptide repeat protein 38 n=1 Tax=Hydra vulgaris TaxID=6087 RepID=A0ABM4CT24_HYDVU
MAWRDCQAWCDEGLSLSTTCNQTARLFDAALNQYVTWTENPNLDGLQGTLKSLQNTSPDFAMGMVLSIGLDLMSTGRTPRLDQEFNNSIKQLNQLSQSNSLSKREKLHCKAVVLFASENLKSACNVWEDILVDYPNDILALKFAYDTYFYLGNSMMIRDSVGRVLPFYKSTNPFYGYLKGMYAFGLQETNLYSLAEKYAKEALTLNQYDCWASHSLAHCYEMTGQTHTGIDFLSSTEEQWKRGSMLACHNYWHWALYHVENGDYDSALDIYDQQISSRTKSSFPLDIVDAVSLLKRLEIQGVYVGERWEDIYEICQFRLNDHVTVFNDAHYLMSCLGAKKEQSVNLFLRSVNDYIEISNGDNKDINVQVGLSLYKSIVAFTDERYDDVVELLYPIKYDLVKIGGSNAQREVFQQLLLEASIKSKAHFKLAKALLHERKLVKENSPLTDRMMSRLLICHE